MQFTCPHCSQSAPLDGYVTRETLAKQVAEKDAAIQGMQQQLSAAAATGKATARLSDELALARAGVTDPTAARRVIGAYKADAEEMGEKAPSFADWIKGEGASVVSPFRSVAAAPSAPPPPAAPAAPSEPAALAQPAAAPPVIPNPSASAVAVNAGQTKMTAEQYSAAIRPLMDQRARTQIGTPARTAIDTQIAELQKQASA